MTDRLSAVLAVIFAICPVSVNAEAMNHRDVVLMLDNSGSMRRSDAELLVSKIARKFVGEADQNTRLALGTFSDQAALIAPLRYVTGNDQKDMIQSLERLAYTGRYTNIPEAITKAVDELRLNGEPGAARSLILLTDGLVDTGDRMRDRDNEEWIRTVVARDAARDNIKIFAIGLTPEADVNLLKQLAVTTGGEFFLAQHSTELNNIFSRINVLSRNLVGTHPGAGLISAAAERRSIANGGDVAVSHEGSWGEKQSSSPGSSLLRDNAVTSTESFAGLLRDPRVMLGLGLFAAMLTLLAFGVRPASRRNHTEPQDQDSDAAPGWEFNACLVDVSGTTGQGRHSLRAPRIMVGRVAPSPEENMQGIIVDLPTIGRRHAVIEWHRGGYWIVDQGSKNGTFVNGRRVRDAVYLMHGDTIRLHNVNFEFAVRGMGYADLTVSVDDDMNAEVEDVTVDEGGMPDAPSYGVAAKKDRRDATVVARPVVASAPGKREPGSARTAKERLVAEVTAARAQIRY